MQPLQPNKKRRDLELILKDKIISGVLLPGQRFPTYEELEREYPASRATFQHVLGKLSRDRYIKSIPRQGMFVAQRIPGQYRIGLMFRSNEHENSFWTALAQAACRYNQTSSFYEFVILRGNVGLTSCEDEFAELRQQLERRLLTGIFFPNPDEHERLINLLHAYPDLPLITFPSPQPNVVQELPRRLVSLNASLLLQLTFAQFRQHKIERIAPIFVSESRQWRLFEQVAADCNFIIPPEWVISLADTSNDQCGRWIRLLMSLPIERRPQGLYISDNNLLDLVQRTIIELGLRPPQDIFLISHANFPESRMPTLNVRRVGFRVDDIIAAIVSHIQHHYSGDSNDINDVIDIPAVCEEH